MTLTSRVELYSKEQHSDTSDVDVDVDVDTDGETSCMDYEETGGKKRNFFFENCNLI